MGETRLHELLAKLEGLARVKGPDAFASRNSLRRSLYKLATRLGDSDTTDPKLSALAAKTLEETCPLERQTPSDAPAALRALSSLLRGLGFVSWGCAGSLLLLLFSWVRILHPLFRKLGLKNGKLPYDRLVTLYTYGILAVIGVKVETEGSEHLRKVPTGSPALVMFSHASNLDPFVLTSSTPLGVQWIGKRSLFLMPIFGWAALAAGMVPVNRSNRAKAIASLNAMKTSVAESARPIGISPEGTRSKTGQLLRSFKKGPFYMREETQSAVIPVLIVGAYELWPPGQFVPSSGKLTLRFLDPIGGDTKLSREEVSAALRKRFLDSLETEPATPRAAGHALGPGDLAKSVVGAALVLCAEFFLLKFVRYGLAASGLSGSMIALVFAILTALVSGFILTKY